MIDASTFDMLIEVGQALGWEKDLPFGGIQVSPVLIASLSFHIDVACQLVVAGDFFQLPPVSRDKKPIRYAFDARHWNNVLEHSFKLNKVFRQADPGEKIRDVP